MRVVVVVLVLSSCASAAPKTWEAFDATPQARGFDYVDDDEALRLARAIEPSAALLRFTSRQGGVAEAEFASAPLQGRNRLLVAFDPTPDGWGARLIARAIDDVVVDDDVSEDHARALIAHGRSLSMERGLIVGAIVVHPTRSRSFVVTLAQPTPPAGSGLQCTCQVNVVVELADHGGVLTSTEGDWVCGAGPA